METIRENTVVRKLELGTYVVTWNWQVCHEIFLFLSGIPAIVVSYILTSCLIMYLVILLAYTHYVLFCFIIYSMQEHFYNLQFAQIGLNYQA